MKVSVIGAGAFGFAIAHRLSMSPDNEVVMWSESASKIEEYEQKGSIDRVLGGHPLPSGIHMTTSMEEAVRGVDMVFVLSTAEFVESVCENMAAFLDERTKVAIGAKGACPDGSLPPNAAEEILGRGVSMFAGPGFAVDIIDDVPVGFTFATLDDEAYEMALDAFSHDPTLMLDRSHDTDGVALCSCLKNAAALACGALYGHGHPISTQCLLMQRVLMDVAKMLESIDGGTWATTMSLSGVGDMILTCFSPKSRNGSFGRIVGEHGFSSLEAQDYLAANTVEGMSVVSAWPNVAEKLGVQSEFMDAISTAFSDGGGIEHILEYIQRADIA